MKPGDAASLARYVLKQAPKYRLDPNAVVAVALQEGISGHVGDSGSSFGPWQLHKGGAYPSSAPQQPDQANAWAWSPAGIDYALGRMSTVAGGLKGRQAVHAIVYQFERPANPKGEYDAAIKALPRSDGGTGGGSGILGDILSGAYHSTPIPTAVGAVEGAKGVVDTASSIGNFLGSLTDPRFWLRAVEVIGGGIILMLGLYLLARSVGLAPSGRQAAEGALKLTPQGRAALAESKAARAIGGG